MSSMEESIEVLKAHRDRITAATTWEGYRDAQTIYLNWLIKDYELQLDRKIRRNAFVEYEWREVKKTSEVPAQE